MRKKDAQINKQIDTERYEEEIQIDIELHPNYIVVELLCVNDWIIDLLPSMVKHPQSANSFFTIDFAYRHTKVFLKKFSCL